MKLQFNKRIVRKFTFMMLTVLSTTNPKAQIIQSTEFAKGSISDARELMEAYLTPVVKSFSAINRAALVHFHRNVKQGSKQFAIGIDLAGALTSPRDKTYDVEALNLSEFTPDNPSATIAQTFAGNSGAVKLVSRTSYTVPSTSYPFYSNKPILSLNTPEGSGTSFLPLAFIHASLILDKAEFQIRLMPPLKIPKTDGRVFSTGASVLLPVQTLIPSMQSFPVNLSVLTGMQLIHLGLDPGLEPEPTRAEISLQAGNGPYDNQKVYITAWSLPLELTACKQTGNWNLYAGAGVNIAITASGLKGTIPLYKADPSNTLKIIVEDIEDPVRYTQNTSSLYLNFGAGYFFNTFEFTAGFQVSGYQTLALGVNLML